MGLMFKDDCVTCSKCNGRRFKEEVIMGLEKNENKYKPIRKEYYIVCINCNTVLEKNEETLLEI